MRSSISNITKKEQLVPQLRFSEFIVTWNEKFFDQISTITRLAGYEYSEYWQEDENGPIIGLRGYNIGKGRLILRDISFISQGLSEKLIRSKLFIGDIVYPCVGTIGNAVVIEENDKFHIQQNIAKITCKDGYHPYFLMHFLTSSYGMKEVYRFNATSSQPNVLVGSLRQFRITLPSLPEQQKIASFLTEVDQKIQQLTRKKHVLESYKKGVMQKIFKQEIRFKQDDGNEFPEWEQRRLGDLCSTFKSGIGITSNEIGDGGSYPVYGGNGFRGYSNEYTHDGYFILIGRQGALCGNINRVRGKTYISEHAIAVQANNSSDTEWLAQMLEALKLNRLSESSAQPGLAVNKLKRLKMIAPSHSEQKKIAGFLSSIDNKVESVNKQIEQTQQFKKGLLQQMFV